MARAVPPTIGTHDGAFHCDEVLGCWMLKRMPQFRGAEITRTRNEEILSGMEVVLDVGGVYDPERFRFDHHQKGFNQVFGHGREIKLSSAGLVYRHYGKELLRSICSSLELSDDDIETLYLKVYKGFVEAIDGIDNGNLFVFFESESSESYVLDNFAGLSSRVSRLNPAWNETDSSVTADGQFVKAMEVCGEDFSSYVIRVAKVTLDMSNTWLPARVHVQSALAERYTVHKSGEIIHLKCFCPWKEHLLDLEQEQSIEGVIKYCIYGDGNGTDYRIQAIPVSLDSFESRLPLPSPWRALRFGELDQASGIEGCVFVHASGFIGGNKTLGGALEMADKAILYSQTYSVP